MIRMTAFLISGLVTFILVGSVVANQLADSSIAIRPEIESKSQIASSRQMVGRISAINHLEKTFRVKNQRAERQFSITPDTEIRKGRSRSVWNDLKPGSNVAVKYAVNDGLNQAHIVRLKP